MSEKFDKAGYERHRKAQGPERLGRLVVGLSGFICIFMVLMQLISSGLRGPVSFGEYDITLAVAGTTLLFIAAFVGT
ncbi:hypothetical protein [Burkholderia sp. Ac-20365]|uniref:hypothetical protein n=1 Tax=Burkholderia sp. Ac-20365 TaxID=2703897 RepID=UPI00197CAC0A|nr:hypothetical protein [Burkholderia sp. Ac-20365]MBN3761110.1 hypothetical protein [Burkholderia sp. Ac-20365]